MGTLIPAIGKAESAHRQVAIFEIADKYPCYEDPRNQRYLVADEFLQYRVSPPETLLDLIFSQRDFFPLGYAFMQG